MVIMGEIDKNCNTNTASLLTTTTEKILTMIRILF
jgi:hypothetical protein